jgi:dolichyl-phosphate beta-glucosyltransferase
MLCARGQYMLMVDADGATKFSDIEKLEAKLKTTENDGYGIAFGSRAHLEDQALAEVKKLFRTQVSVK